ncbi:peptidoglycan D,D-transpeptidase FtsI family protein [Nitratifractor salsuginis]|nr:penicillin-binding protein 2 [Nitratifractor salsuginis]
MAVVLIAGFLSAVLRIQERPRKMPPHTSVIHDRALRGAILSREGYTISRSNKTYEATVHARSIDPEKKELFIRLFAIYSGLSEKEVRQAFLDKKGHPKKGFVVLSKEIDASTAIQLKYLAYQLRRLHVFRSFPNKRGVQVLYGLDILENGEEREFQLKDTLTPVIGYVRSRNVGRYRKIYGVKGLEKRYEPYLNKTQDGLVRGMRDVIGTIIRNKSSLRIPRRDGYNLHLNVSLALQKYVEATLDRMKEETGAKEIIAAVMESRSGKLLTLASSERYDPAHITQADIPKLNAKFTEYPYEPGSVIKPLTLAIALDKNRVTPDTVINTYNGGPFHISKHQTITDDEAYDSLSATDIIVHSSNIGISQIAWRLSGAEFHKGLSAFGLGRRTGIDLSRELPGRIKPARLLERKPHEANQAYGYGMHATFVQLLRAHNAFNNGGLLVTPRIVDSVTDASGKKYRIDTPAPHRIIKPHTARQLHRILEKVVSEGTGVAAQYPGLDIGGKTGTAHITEHGHYVKKYNSSFYGFANDDKGHRYEIGVLVIQASKYHKYFAAQSAVPTFKAIVDDMVELGYLHPNLTPEQREAMLAKEKKRRAAARKKQQERTRQIKELLRRQREQMRRQERKNHTAPRHRRPAPIPARVHHKPRVYTPAPIPRRRTPHEALPDMF